MTLQERADAVRARNKILESVPGSGFHDNDRDWSNRLAAPHRRHQVGGMTEGKPALPRISEHVVCFNSRYQITFAGTDAVEVLEAFQLFRTKTMAHKKYSLMTGTELKMVEEIAEMQIDADGNLTLDRATWNDYLYVWDEMGIGISCAPLVPDGTTP